MKIVVRAPAKTATRYAFAIEVRYPDGSEKTIQIGVENANFQIPHAEVWDTFYPLMFITRNGGPLFGTSYGSATITFDYSTSRPVVEYFIRRAESFGLCIEVTSRLAEIGLDKATSGDLLLFGGGKDSRLLLGMMRETGLAPTVISAEGEKYAPDIPDALKYSAINFSMPNRIVPALMLLPRTVYHGSALGEVHMTSPWHQYIDISTPHALGETTDMFRSIGLDISFQVPLVVLPYNLVQKMLAERYTDLYRHQLSVTKNARVNKTLHVALAKIYHGLDFADCCDEAVMIELAEAFVRRLKTDRARVWGYRGNYEVIAREMASILYRLTRDGRLSLETPVPADWDEDWIDQIHSYANRDVPEAFRLIYA